MADDLTVHLYEQHELPDETLFFNYSARCPSWGPWLIDISVRFMEGRLAVTKLLIEFDPIGPDGLLRVPMRMPDSGITADALRSIRLGEILEAIRAEIAEFAEFDAVEAAIGRGKSDRLRSLRQKLAEASKEAGALGRGRKQLPDDFFREVAELRLDLQNEGVSGINRRLAEELGVSESTAKDYLRRSREGGWLAPGVRGRSEAFPGPRLLEAARLEQESEGSE